MGITPLVFTGISEFSDDFQVILDRAVAIAALPLQDMQNEQADLLTKKQLLSSLRSVVAGLGTSVEALATVGENRALSATTSNTNRVSVTLNGASAAGVYTITEITSVAKAASETTLSGYASSDATAVSTDGTLELVVGSDTYVIDVTGDNSLDGLRDAINALDAGVSATVLNTGTGPNPYYLSITALNTGATTLELRETAGDGGSNILTTDNQGADAIFKLNGLTVTKPENTINDVISGVTLTIKSLTEVDESVAVTLSSSRGELAGALADLVDAYNSVRDAVNLQIGEDAGLLSGDFIVREVQVNMRRLAGLEGEGAVKTLMEMGIEFDTEGVMSFDSGAFCAMSESDFSSALDFLASETAGVQALADSFDAISDPVTGLIRMQQDQYDSADARLSDQIDALAERIDYMQQSVSLKLQQADVLLAQLQSQQMLLEATIESLTLATFGRQED